MQLHFERIYDHPIDAVWTALTDARALRQWWLDTDFVPELGRTFFLKDVAQGGWDGIVRGRVLELDAPRRVRFSWESGGNATVVTYDLTQTLAGKTQLVITHTGFEGAGGILLATMLRSGWGGFIEKDVPEMADHIARVGIDQPFPVPPKAERVGSAA